MDWLRACGVLAAACLATAGCSGVEQVNWDIASRTATVQGYTEFLMNYPDSPHAPEARRRLGEVRDELQRLREAAAAVLPEAARIDADTVERYPEKPRYSVTVRIFEDVGSPEEIRPDRQQALRDAQAVRGGRRCVRVLRSIVDRGVLPDGGELQVDSYQAVRASAFPGGLGLGEFGTTICMILAPIDDLAGRDLSGMSDAALAERYHAKCTAAPRSIAESGYIDWDEPLNWRPVTIAETPEE